MSKDFIKNVFSKLPSCSTWSSQLIQIKNGARTGTSYFSREIELSPPSKIKEYVQTLSQLYTKEEGVIDSFSSVDLYSGDVIDHTIYKLQVDNQLIKEAYDRLITSISNPNKEVKISDIKPNACLLKGHIVLDSNGPEIDVLLVSMQKPITLLSNRYWMLETGVFHEISAPILTLRNTIDVMIVGSTMYMFNLSGENLFNMERSYKAVCMGIVDEIVKCDYLSDADTFKTISNQGRNPRRFISYNALHFEALSDIQRRKELANIFGFSITSEGIINTQKIGEVEKLIKFLCNKAMLDPCNSTPMEVSATKPWI